MSTYVRTCANLDHICEFYRKHRPDVTRIAVQPEVYATMKRYSESKDPVIYRGFELYVWGER